ncbi:MAG: Asp23/Gls24 family envelope stress response protein [Firmicutes bacterium]|nr:Asp23/Gls24 family envelope stress response protein [Bacillota bacterium]
MKQDIGYSNEKGKVAVDKTILLSVIHLATKEISGVAGMGEAFSVKLRNKSKTSQYDGVKVNYLPNGIEIFVNIIVYSDVSVPSVSYKVQENIRNGVASLIDNKVLSININVCSVELK